MIRTIVIVLTVVLFLILAIPVLIVETIIGKFNEPLMRRSSLRIIQAVFRLILKETGSEITIRGKENIPTDRSVLYVSNHRSYFDILLAYTNVYGLCGFIAKKELGQIPLLNLWMRKLYCLFLDRDDMKAGLAVIQQAIEYEKKGISIHLCPEGTRNHKDEMLPFKEGGFKIAERSGCPIVPTVVFHTDDIFEKHEPFIRPAHVTIWFGEPIFTEQMERAEKKHLGPRVRSVLEDMIRKLREEEAQAAR